MISTSNLGKTFFDKKLFSDVNLQFKQGHTYGIIGANGSGKSTFLKIIAGLEESSSGEVIISKNSRISILKQDQNIFNHLSVTEAVIAGNDVLAKIERDKNAIYNNPNASTKDYEKAAELEEEFGNLGGWNAESDAQILLEGLGIKAKKHHQKMSELKSSDKVKVLVASALFGNPEILILDEPTNHLDLRAIKWLERFLSAYPNLVLLVSHDSDFLDQVCTHIVDIDFQQAKMYTGNYSFWKQSSQLALELQQKQNLKAEEKRAKLEEFIARFSANASKSSQATSRKKALDKITIDEIVPSTRRYPYIRFNLNRPIGKDILRVENLSYKDVNGKYLFQSVSFTIKKGDKMVLIGNDDIANTKLLEILVGITKPTSGIVVWGKTITHDFYAINNDAFFNNDLNLLEWASQWPLTNTLDENRDNSDSKIRGFLGQMLFSGDSVFKKSKNCSGGEKARLMLAKMMLKESNFLIFDQPLEHLDTESIDAVIEGLNKYLGSVIFTTYNRAFIKEVANMILEIYPDASYVFHGTLDEYEQKKGY